MKHPRKARYTLVKGEYWIHNPQDPRRGPQPDGDTVTFKPESVELLQRLPRFSGRAPAIHGGRINVRYEGIDTLETHFGNGPRHQNLRFAQAARGHNLDALGFTGVSFYPDQPNVVQAVDVNPLPGYVLANGIESNGRLLGLVYTGTAPWPDGTPVFVDEQMLERSVNTELVRAGLAYVEPYDTMPMALVRRLRAVVHQVRNDHHGMWPEEGVSTSQGAEIRSLDELQALVMWPKLFRRLVTYFEEGHDGLAQFDVWIRQDRVQRDDTLRLPDGEKGNMHDTYEVDGDTLRLRFAPEDLLVTPDPKPASAL